MIVHIVVRSLIVHTLYSYSYLCIPDFQPLAAIHQPHVLVREVEEWRHVLEPRDARRRDAVSLTVDDGSVVLFYLHARLFTRTHDAWRY